MNEYIDRLGFAEWVSKLRGIHSELGSYITKDIQNIEFEFFWSGIYSQWDPSDFTVVIPKNDLSEKYPFTFNRAEQFMMWSKAFMFGDTQTADAILNSSDPAEQKRLGRNASGFINDVWVQNAQDVVLIGNLAKFSQDHTKLKKLINTNNRLLVESSPKDRIWGIGLHKTDIRALDPNKWLGTNWLGIAITHVKELMNSTNQIHIDTISQIIEEISGNA